MNGKTLRHIPAGFKEIPNFKGYYCNDFGEIRTAKYFRSGKVVNNQHWTQR